jgi:hypothetical protein
MREEAAGQIDNERMPGVVVTVDGDKQVKKSRRKRLVSQYRSSSSFSVATARKKFTRRTSSGYSSFNGGCVDRSITRERPEGRRHI